MNLYKIEKTPNTISTSWNTAITAPTLNDTFLKRNKMYKKTTIKEPKTAHNADVLMSSAMVGSTFI